jgi:ABC-type transport system involved in multi-copper enzyme maturation permease subunit
MVEKESVTVKRRRWLRGRGARRGYNPLLIKELRGRMRGARAFVVLTVYLLLLSCFTSLIYYAYTALSNDVGSGADMTYLGQAIFATVVIIEIFMVTFITPAFTAGAISGERERKTYELLRTTLLTAPKLVFGKLSSALTYMFLLILAAVPVESLAFILGGVVLEELAVALLMLLVTALAFAAIGILFSSFMRSTLASTVLAYITALLLTIGLPLVMLISVGLLDTVLYDWDPSAWIVEAALMYLICFIISLSPVSAAIAAEIVLQQEGSLWYFWYDVDSGHRIIIPSFWISYTVIYLALALLLLLITILRVRRQERQ